MSAIRQDDIAETAEQRIANVLRSHESDDGTAADCLRWSCKNWLKARRGLYEIASTSPDPDIQRAVLEALEVDDER